MSTLSKTVKTGIIAAASAAVLLVAPTAASASTTMQYGGGNWAAQILPAGQGCYAWTNWTSYTVTAHVYQQADAGCHIEIQQWWRGPNGTLTGRNPQDTTGVGQTATAPNNSVGYYYYGPASGGTGYLCVYVYAWSYAAMGDNYGVVYGTGC